MSPQTGCLEASQVVVVTTVFDLHTSNSMQKETFQFRFRPRLQPSSEYKKAKKSETNLSSVFLGKSKQDEYGGEHWKHRNLRFNSKSFKHLRRKIERKISETSKAQTWKGIKRLREERRLQQNIGTSNLFTKQKCILWSFPSWTLTRTNVGKKIHNFKQTSLKAFFFVVKCINLWASSKRNSVIKTS